MPAQSLDYKRPAQNVTQATTRSVIVMDSLPTFCSDSVFIALTLTP